MATMDAQHKARAAIAGERNQATPYKMAAAPNPQHAEARTGFDRREPFAWSRGGSIGLRRDAANRSAVTERAK
jgi:hypothetical protein